MAAALSMPLGNFHVASFPTGEGAAVERQLFAPGGQGESALASRVPPSAAMPAGTVASAARRPIEGSTRREHVARSGSAAAIEELRALLAAEAAIPVALTALTGVALVRAVAEEVRHFQLVTALLHGAVCGAPANSARPTRPALSAAAVLRCPDGLALARRWASSVTKSATAVVTATARPSVTTAPPVTSLISAAAVGAATSVTVERGAAPVLAPCPCALHVLFLPQRLPTLQLQRMPPDFATLTMQLHRRTCAACGKVPQVEPALCLICGALLCAGPSCKRVKGLDEPREGECTRHARRCGLGVGIFALVHQGVTLLVDGRRSAFHPSLYLDAHGEEDLMLRRGKPLFLSTARQAALHRLWLAQAVPLEVARSRASAPHAAIRLGLY